MSYPPAPLRAKATAIARRSNRFAGRTRSPSSLTTATWPMSSVDDAGENDAGAGRRPPRAAWCFHSCSYTRPRRVRRSSVDAGFGRGVGLALSAAGATGIEHLPVVDGGGGGVDGGGV